MESKTCTKCKVTYPATQEYFNSAPKGRAGLYSQCKDCRRTANRERMRKSGGKYNNPERSQKYRDAHKEEAAAYRKIWREANKQEISRKKREYRKANGPALSMSEKRSRAKNKEAARVYQREWNQRNAESRREYRKKYKETHKERLAKQSREYAQRTRGRARMSDQKRRAYSKQTTATLTREQWAVIQEVFGNACAYCGKSEALTQDHFVPLSQSGEYTHNNIVPACKSCNSSKYNRDFFEWYPSYRYYSKHREKAILRFLNYKKGETATQQLMVDVM